MSDPILEVEQVATHFPVQTGSFFKRRTELVRAVDGVSFELCEGEILGLVGESGCGKSTLARSILNLVPVTSGLVKLNGKVFNKLPLEEPVGHASFLLQQLADLFQNLQKIHTCQPSGLDCIKKSPQ